MNKTIGNRHDYGMWNILLLIIVSFSLAGPAYSADFTLLYSNDVRGKTKPCG